MVAVVIDPSTARLLIEYLLEKEVLSIFPERLPGRMRNGYFDVAFTDGSTQRISEWEIFLWGLEVASVEDPNCFAQEVAQWRESVCT